MMRGAIRHFVMACTLVAASSLTLPASAIESRPVRFAKGASSTTLEGSLEGDQIIDYTLRAEAGQAMSVSLKTSSLSNYFNVLAPGSKDVAMFVGSTSGIEWTESLASGGDYTIRVYLMRSAARRNETAHYKLTVGITGNPTAAEVLGPAPVADAKVEGSPYHATGQVPCSMGGAPQGAEQCDYGVIRGKPGHAQVHLTPRSGFKRVLTFIADKVTSDGGAAVKASKSGDLWLIDVNDHEHYRIPDAVLSGG